MEKKEIRLWKEMCVRTLLEMKNCECSPLGPWGPKPWVGEKWGGYAFCPLECGTTWPGGKPWGGKMIGWPWEKWLGLKNVNWLTKMAPTNGHWLNQTNGLMNGLGEPKLWKGRRTGPPDLGNDGPNETNGLGMPDETLWFGTPSVPWLGVET